MNSNIQRDFILGDEWFYFKLYTGVKTADSLLIEMIDPLTNQLIEKGLIDKWFFIRYSDPNFHLRVRFHVAKGGALGEIIEMLNAFVKPFLENQFVAKFQADTYSRELERYGESTIELAESLFFYDSQMTLQLLNLIEGDEGETYRWHFACMAVNSLLNDFGLDAQEQLDLLDRLQTGFGNEFGMNTQLKVQLDKRFRDERATIRGFLLQENEFYQPFYEILSLKSKNTAAIIEQIRELYQNDKLTPNLDSLLGSYIHMLLNRIFKSKQRLNELVIYSLLYRFYRSEIARRRKSS